MGFNPCFNGRCKRTMIEKNADIVFHVVSILVLMEDVKELKTATKPEDMTFGFNPCFNGRCKRTGRKRTNNNY